MRGDEKKKERWMSEYETTLKTSREKKEREGESFCYILGLAYFASVNDIHLKSNDICNSIN